MRVVVTGGAGFIGGRRRAASQHRGDEVVAVRPRPVGRASLAASSAPTLIAGDLGRRRPPPRRDARRRRASSTRRVYQVGIPAARTPARCGTPTSARRAGPGCRDRRRLPRIVYISTVNVFGNTHGAVVDESYQRDLAEGFLSWYDETKYRAHEVAEARIAAGAPIVIVMPSQVYGPHDHSRRRAARTGVPRHAAATARSATSAPACVHVDDLAAGIVAALDRGAVGRAYVLAGPRTTLGEAIAIAARLGGRRPPRSGCRPAPPGRWRPIGGSDRPAANLREIIGVVDGVTYWASRAKARPSSAWPRARRSGRASTT